MDILTDGEMRRESYSNRFATALEGVDIDHPGEAPTRTPGRTQPVPRVIGPVRRRQAVAVRDVRFLRANTARAIKITLPGPFTMSMQTQDDYYKDEVALAMDYARAVNEEFKDLFAAGADVVQIDEPYMQARPDKAAAFGVAALNRALEGAAGTTAVHLCFGYAAFVKARPSGYSFLPELAQSTVRQISIETAQSRLDCAVLRSLPGKTSSSASSTSATGRSKSPETVAARIRRALPHVAAERLVIAPDCGMKYLPRDVAFGKLKAMVEGARIVRDELSA